MQPGTQLGHYEILSPLGKGGMGEVWRARDSKLGREVAIKTLPEEFARDEERLVRFEREAKLLASLNHPNIAAIYGLEEDNGTRFLVLELVEGDKLAERLKRGAIPVEESLTLALQIAEALEAAHEKGVIHRDLKPANIKVTPDGKIKVLDFGLAKAFAGNGSDVNLSQSPTLSMAATQQGIILGTAAYMSPEQASGQEVDKRADVWAFGAVLFEMLTGRGVFPGHTVSHVLASVLTTDPALETLPPETPAMIRRLLRRCLEKDPKDRLHDIADARLDIKEAQGGAPIEAVTPSGTLRSLPLIAAGMAFGIVVGAIAVWGFQPGSPDPLVRKTLLPVAGPLIQYDQPEVSPDGLKVAYTRNGRLWIQHLNQLEPLEVSDSYGASDPFWSPDSDLVGYHSLGVLKSVSAEGGPSTDIAPVPGEFAWGTWSPDGTIVFATTDSGLIRVSDQGGEPQLFIEPNPGELGLRGPRYLPDGQSLLFVVLRPDATRELFVQSGERRTSLISGLDIRTAVYSPTGHILYALRMQDGIWAVPFSDSTMTRTGDRFPVDENGRHPSVSSEGTLVYMLVDSTEQLVWVNRNGEVVGTIGQPQSVMWEPALSPDGGRVAVQGQETGSVDIWIHNVERGSKTPIVFGPGFDDEPAWSPSGDQIVFTSQRAGASSDIFVKDVEGSGEERPLVTGPSMEHAPNWSPDGQYIAYFSLDPTVGNQDLWYVELTEGAEPQILLKTPFDETLPQFSPDGNYVAFQSNQSGRWEIFLARFPSGEVLEQVSINGGIHPKWSPQGDDLFYLEENTLTSVAVETEPALELGLPEALFDIEQVGMRLYLGDGASYPTYTVGETAERFIVVQTVQPPGATGSNVVVVQNWFEEVKRRVPVP